MAEESVRQGAYKIGSIGAILSAVGILMSGPMAILLVALVQPQPPWDGAALFVDSFHRIQTLPFYLAYLLVSGSILMMVSVYLLSNQRATALAALVFMSIGAALAVFNYLTQTTFIPAVVGAYSPELDPVITILSMSNSGSLTWAIEMWAYGFMGLGTWLAASFFATSRLERIGKFLFIANGVISVLGALLVSIDLSGVFSIAGLIGYGVWNVLYFVLAVIFYRVLQRRQFEEQHQS